MASESRSFTNRFVLFQDVESNFWAFSLLLGINHAAATIPLIFATSRITGSCGQATQGVFNITCLFFALFVSPYVSIVFRARATLIMSFLLFSLDVGILFPLASVQEEGSALQWILGLLYGFSGGAAGGILWTAWGKYMSDSCAILAENSAEGVDNSKWFEKLSSVFGAIYLFSEFTARLGSWAILQWYKDVPLFIYYGIVAFITSALMFCVQDIHRTAAPSRVTEKLTLAVKLWPDVRIWLIGMLSIAFGFSAALMNGSINGQVKTDIGEQYVGLMCAATTLMATGMSLALRLLTPVMRNVNLTGIILGSVSFLVIAIIVLGTLFTPHSVAQKMQFSIVILYTFQGIGRGAYESVNKAVYGKMYPHNSVGAYANQMMQTTMAFSICFFLQAAGAASVLPLSIIIIIFGAAVVPCYFLAKKLRPADIDSTSTPVSDAARSLQEPFLAQ